MELRKSTIPGAGEGVFAKRKLKKGENLGMYYGDYLTTEEFHALPPERQNYTWRLLSPVGQYEYVDAEPYKKYPGTNQYNHPRYVNGAANDKQRARINTEVDQDGLTLYYRATKDIPKGKELICDYGASYFLSRGMSFGLKQQFNKRPVKSCAQRIGNKGGKISGKLANWQGRIDTRLYYRNPLPNGTEIIYWAAMPPQESQTLPNVGKAYRTKSNRVERMPDPIENGGVAYVNNGFFSYSLLKPTKYKGGGMNHIHFRTCGKRMGPIRFHPEQKYELGKVKTYSKKKKSKKSR